MSRSERQITRDSILARYLDTPAEEVWRLQDEKGRILIRDAEATSGALGIPLDECTRRIQAAWVEIRERGLLPQNGVSRAIKNTVRARNRARKARRLDEVARLDVELAALYERRRQSRAKTTKTGDYSGHTSRPERRSASGVPMIAEYTPEAAAERRRHQRDQEADWAARCGPVSVRLME